MVSSIEPSSILRAREVGSITVIPSASTVFKSFRYSEVV